MIRHQTTRGTIYEAAAEDVYPTIADGSVSLVICDGPYNMRKAEWDKFKTWDDFRDFYRPHVEAWGRVCAESATVYVWGTDDSLYHLRGMIEAMGWDRRSRVTWDKVATPAQIGWKGARGFLEVTEACDVYVRGDHVFNPSPRAVYTVWRFDLQNGLRSERIWDGPPVREPRRDKSKSVWMTKQSLHPCQKPLSFYRRMIRASSRPGDTVLEPFGGTCRAAVAVEQMDEPRRYVCIERNGDGKDYLGPVVEQVEDAIRSRESSLFAGTP